MSALLTLAERDDESHPGSDFPQVLMEQIKALKEQLENESLPAERAGGFLSKFRFGESRREGQQVTKCNSRPLFNHEPIVWT